MENKENNARGQAVFSPRRQKKRHLSLRDLAEQRSQDYFEMWFGEVRVFVVVKRRRRRMAYYQLTRYSQIHPVIRNEFGKGHIMLETIGVRICV